jgi:hypothetical protein
LWKIKEDKNMDKLKLIEALKELIEKGEVKAHWEDHETNITGLSIDKDGNLILDVDDF